MFSRIPVLLVAGALLTACATTYDAQTSTIINLIGGGLTTRTEVSVPPYTVFNAADGAYCEVYQVRQYNVAGNVRYGNATVCHYAGQPWFLAGRQFTTAWLPTTYPIPQPSPSYPVPGTSHPVPNPSYPVNHPQPTPTNPPVQPAPAPSQPGQWVPVTR